MNIWHLKYYFYLLAVVVSALNLNAQGIGSRDGNFQVDFNEGCAPLTVEITSRVPCNCNVFFDSDITTPNKVILEPDRTYSFVYDEPGTFELGVTAANLPRDILIITVYPNDPPEFTTTVCANREVNVEITDNNYDAFTIDYGDASGIVPGAVGSNQHTYAATGNYNIEVKGLYSSMGADSDTCDEGNSSIDAVAVLSDATITSLALTSINEATMEYTLSPNTKYDLEIQINNDNPNNFTRFIENLSGSEINISNPGINFEQNYYCFRIVTIDPCNGTRTNSNTICSIDLDEITVGDLSNNININASANGLSATGHVVQRKNDDLDFAQVRTLPASTNWDDNDVICNIEYCYRIVSEYGPATTTSLTRCATTLSLQTPSTIEDISIDASDDPILFWTEPTDFVADTYSIFSLSALSGTSNINNFTDNNSNSSTASICYEIDYVDECGNTSDLSNPVCSIFLSSFTTNTITSLRWTTYDGWNNGVASYQVIKNGDFSNPVYDGLDLTFTPASVQNEQRTLYQVIAIPNDGTLEDSKSNIMFITNRSNIIFPTAFVANGTNNEFKVVGRYIVDFDLKIYTRWGELIAHITDHNTGWDGTQNGQELPEGNYIYAAEIVDEANNTHKRSGAVLLLRK